MIEAFGSALPVAVAVALSPFPIIAVVLVLLSPTGRSAGLAFLAGRVVGVAAIVGVFATMSDLVEQSDDVSLLGAVARVLVGVSLVVLAVWKWPGWPREEKEPKLPGWMSAIEGSSPWRAARTALLLSVANPKEVLLGVGAGIIIGSVGLPLGPTLVVAAAYTVIACLSVAVPVLAFVVAPERMRDRLEHVRVILVRHNAAIMSVVLLVIGAALIGGGLSDL
ncbi:GAP family protein [Cryobacterium cryoconiti]|uniref:GAP family protein n=1 Tax=Cryobacterium cryoconiti TaxID=1259239 RepID=A0A4Y8JYI7_9MICO|nr:GAP family protein [Cryobacterium cryoconiti]TFD27926.1 GAP family protein [Cryobacterium cryoconiti]